jgi:hypothetical protein
MRRADHRRLLRHDARTSARHAQGAGNPAQGPAPHAGNHLRCWAAFPRPRTARAGAMTPGDAASAAAAAEAQKLRRRIPSKEFARILRNSARFPRNRLRVRTAPTDPPRAAGAEQVAAQGRQAPRQPQPRARPCRTAGASGRPRPPAPSSAGRIRGHSRARRACRAPAPSPRGRTVGRWPPASREQRRHLQRQAQQDPAGRHRARVARGSQDGLQFVVGQARGSRGDTITRTGMPGRRQPPDRSPAAARARGSAVPSAAPARIQRGERNPHRASPCAAIGPRRSMSRSTSVPLVVMATGWLKSLQHLEQLARDAVFCLDGLVGVGVGAQAMDAAAYLRAQLPRPAPRRCPAGRSAGFRNPAPATGSGRHGWAAHSNRRSHVRSPDRGSPLRSKGRSGVGSTERRARAFRRTSVRSSRSSSGMSQPSATPRRCPRTGPPRCWPPRAHAAAARA